MDTQIKSLKLAVGNLDLLANHKVLSIKEVDTRSEPLLTFGIFLGLRTLSCPKERRLSGSRKDIPTQVTSMLQLSVDVEEIRSYPSRWEMVGLKGKLEFDMR